MGRRVFRKVENWKRGMKRGKDKKEGNKCGRTFHSLHIHPPVHTHTTAALECDNLLH